MRTSPLLADFIHARGCKPKCKILDTTKMSKRRFDYTIIQPLQRIIRQCDWETIKILFDFFHVGPSFENVIAKTGELFVVCKIARKDRFGDFMVRKFQER